MDFDFPPLKAEVAILPESDVLTKSQRSFCMSQIKSKDTKPEIALRKALWHRGFRYRLNYRLLGHPDMVLVGRKVAIFVDGCFWHKCPYHFVCPKTRANFWLDKINGNVERDRRAEESLRARGWFVIRIWEHEIKDSLDDCVQRVSRMLEQKDSV